MENTQRQASIGRETRETSIKLTFNADGTGKSAISTGIGFLDHMLELFAKHGFFDLEIEEKGDLHVDCHHTMEDLGLALGTAIAQALGDKAGIRRYGSCLLPMDEALAEVALDLSGRPYLVYKAEMPAAQVANIDVRLFHEFFQGFCVKCGLNLHFKMLASAETHHLFEAMFKGLAKALDEATRFDERIKGVLSTKGIL